MFLDGQGMDARFNLPAGIALDRAGDLIVADKDNHRIRRISPTGAVSTITGSDTVGHADGKAEVAVLAAPTAVAVGPDGTVLFTDQGSNSLRRITPTGVVRQSPDQPHDATTRPKPTGVAFAFLGRRAEIGRHRGSGHAGSSRDFISPDGSYSIGARRPHHAQLRGRYEQRRQFSSPVGLAVDASGNVLVSDRGNSRLRSLQLTGP
jgi:DNA-binding beta-propeller fold protein YncE